MRARGARTVAGAAVLAVLLQVALTVVGVNFPDASGLYGAPLPVGQSNPPNIFFGGGTSTFTLPTWALDTILTGTALLLLARALRGSLWLAAVTAGLALVVGFSLIILQELGVFGDRLSASGAWNWGQLLVWAWVLVAVVGVWSLARAFWESPAPPP